MLKEGKPLNDEILDAVPKYFRISLADSTISKITIQLTTIHGDPDLFVSRTEKLPNFNNFEKRSIRCGIFPELVEHEKNSTNTLEGDYFI
jgi:hypothetical protein